MHGRNHEAPLSRDAAAAPRELRRIRWDTWSGMLYSNVTAFFIILATAVTLNVQGITNIETAAQAASALKPLAGNLPIFCSHSAFLVSVSLACRCWPDPVLTHYLKLWVGNPVLNSKQLTHGAFTALSQLVFCSLL